MTTIKFNDPVIAKIVKQEGIDNITKEVMEYIKNKFAKKDKTIISPSIDQQIRALKVTNPKRANRLKKARKELNTLLDPNKKNLTLTEAKEQYFSSRANQL